LINLSNEELQLQFNEATQPPMPLVLKSCGESDGVAEEAAVLPYNMSH